MPAMERTGERRAVLFARDDLPTPARKRRDAVVQELRCLADSSDIETVEVVEWAKRVPVGAGSAAQDHFEAFESWAAEAGVALSPFFDTRLCYDAGTEMREELVLPALCLAVYEDGDLQTVAPHTDGPGTVSVEDLIEWLAVNDAADERRRATATP